WQTCRQKWTPSCSRPPELARTSATARRPHSTALPGLIQWSSHRLSNFGSKTKAQWAGTYHPRFRGKSASAHWANCPLRKCTGQKDGAVLTARATLSDQENHVLSAFQSGRDLREVVLAIDRLLVNLEDYVAAAQAYVIGERTSLDVLHDNAFACGNVQPIGNIGGHGANAES